MSDQAHAYTDEVRKRRSASPAAPSFAEDEFESTALDEPAEVEEHLGEDDEILRLVAYLETVSHTSYRRQDFDDRLDDAKLAVQVRNYRKSSRKGYLQEEMQRLWVHVDVIPRLASYSAAGLVLIWGFAALLGVDLTGRLLNLLGLSGPSMPITTADIVLRLLVAAFAGVIVSQAAVELGGIVWFRQFDYKDVRTRRAKSIRLLNHDVLVNKIKSLQLVSGEKARNKDPDRGSTGLLRVYLLFICGYVLHKTLNRCYTRFKEDFDEILIPNVLTRISGWWFAAAVSVLMVGFAFALRFAFPSIDMPAGVLMFHWLGLFGLPLLTGWAVHRYLHHRSLRGGSRVRRQLAYVEGLYKTRIPRDILASFHEPESQRARFDFPSTYEYNDIEDYSVWLHETLASLKRHEDETRS